MAKIFVATMKNPRLMRHLILVLAAMFWLPSFGLKTDTVVVNLKARIVALERKLESAKTDSSEVARLREGIAAMDEKVDYLSEGNDRAINHAWAALGLVVVIAFTIVGLNFVNNRNVYRRRIATALEEMRKYVEAAMDARIEEKTRPEFNRLDRNDTRIEVRALFAERDFRQREAGGSILDAFRTDEFGKLLKWLEAEKELCLAHPPFTMTEALTRIKVYLESHPISLHNRAELEKILAEFDDKHAVHVAAVRAAIKPIEGTFS